jgi:hypothetical protein
MPYIKGQGTRNAIEDGVHVPGTAGELNYKLTMVALEYLESHGESYQTYAEIVSAFECAKLEMYRRQVVPYENQKRMENGDVYPNGE